MSIDVITLRNIIFKDKEKYKYITDKDKENNFYILNKKFAYRDIKKAQFFNKKNIDKASSLDVWFNIFTNSIGIPVWYYQAKIQKTKKIKSPFKKEEIDDLKIRYNLLDEDIEFLIKYYLNDMKSTIKRLKKFKRN